MLNNTTETKSNHNISEETQHESDHKDSIQTKDVFSDIGYICSSNALIIESLKRGLDITQMPSGDVIVTEVQTTHTQYSWNINKNKMVKISKD